MNASRKILVCLQFVVVILMLWGAAPASADSPMPENKVPGPVERTARLLTHDLKRQGYEVARGYFKLYTQDDCQYTYEVLGSCLGNNPAAPYVMPTVPAWPDEWVDPGTVGMVGPTEGGTNASFRFDPHEAILIFGRLPPQAAYFGLQTYLFSRQANKWDEDSTQYQFVKEHIPALLNMFFTKLPKNDKRLEIIADLGDPINNVVIESESGAVWDEERYFVITPDQNMDSAVRQALDRLLIPDKDVFTVRIPSQLGEKKVAVGLQKASDDFWTLIRYAMPYDGGDEGSASDAWRKNPPLVVLRIRDTPPARPPKPYPWVGFEARYGTEPKPETRLEPDLHTLAKAICRRWGQPCDLEGQAFDQRVPRLVNMPAPPLRMTGPECVKVGMNCLAPTEDTVYFLSSKLPFPNDRAYALIGALGTLTGNATYVGVGLNSSLTQLGFDNIDGQDLVGSADGYDVPNHDLFFIQYFARDCTDEKLVALTGGHCYSIGDKLPNCYDPADPTCAMLGITVRDYLLPASQILPDSQRGPKPELTLAPRVIALQRP